MQLALRDRVRARLRQGTYHQFRSPVLAERPNKSVLLCLDPLKWCPYVMPESLMSLMNLTLYHPMFLYPYELRVCHAVAQVPGLRQDLIKVDETH